MVTGGSAEGRDQGTQQERLMGAAGSTTAPADSAPGAACSSREQQAGSNAAAAQPQQQLAGMSAVAPARPASGQRQRQRVRLDLSTPDSSPLQAQPLLAVAVSAQSPGGCCDRELTTDCVLSPVPFAATSFIANDDAAGGAVACIVSSDRKKQRQQRRLSVAIPGGNQEGGCRNPLSAAQSPLGTVMASLMEEAAKAGNAQANTPWSAPNTSLRLLLSPRGSAPDPVLLPATPCFSSALAAATAAAAAGASAHLWDDACAASSAGADGGLCVGQHTCNALGPQHGPSPTAATSKLVRHKRTYSDFYDDGGRCAATCDVARAAAAAAMSSPGRPNASDLSALEQWQQMIEAAEQQWGSSHPAVGRAWLELARALQAADKQSEAAKHATKKAFDICQILLQQTAVESRAAELGQYLLAKFSSKAVAAKQAAAAAAAQQQQQQLHAAAATPDAQHCLPAPSAPVPGTTSGVITSAMLQLQQAAAVAVAQQQQQQQLALLLQQAAGGCGADAAQQLAAHAAMLGVRGSGAAAKAAKVGEGASPAAAAAAAGGMSIWDAAMVQQLALMGSYSGQLAQQLGSMASLAGAATAAADASSLAAAAAAAGNAAAL